jgi:hypothetical protein
MLWCPLFTTYVQPVSLRWVQREGYCCISLADRIIHVQRPRETENAEYFSLRHSNCETSGLLQTQTRTITIAVVAAVLAKWQGSCSSRILLPVLEAVLATSVRNLVRKEFQIVTLPVVETTSA